MNIQSTGSAPRTIEDRLPPKKRRGMESVGGSAASSKKCPGALLASDVLGPVNGSSPGGVLPPPAALPGPRAVAVLKRPCPAPVVDAIVRPQAPPITPRFFTFFPPPAAVSKRPCQGKCTYPNGVVYEGQVKDGKPHGQGKYTFPSGAVYEGQFQNGKRHGQGKLTFLDGGVYEGQFQNDKLHGQGKLTFPNGDVYEGQFQNDKRHGQGKYTYASGDVYEGQFQNGMRHGQGKYTNASGDVYEGQFQNDVRADKLPVPG